MSYITVSEVRDADPTGEGYPDYTNDQIQEAIDRAQAFIETHTGQFFEERDLTLNLDGNGGRILHLPIPIITLTKLQLNHSGYDDDLAFVEVYNGRAQPQDDRKNPKIALRPDDDLSIFAKSYRNGRREFKKGFRNQLLGGKFGYTEADGSTPLRIKRANLRLVILELEAGGVSASPLPHGTVTREVTDGHSISYGEGGGGGKESLTGDAEIDQIIMDYKAPAYVGITRRAYY